MAYDRHEALDQFVVRFKEYPGFTMRVRKASLAGRLAVAEALPALRRATLRGADPAADLKTLRSWKKMCKALGGALAEWDLLNSGKLVPATPKGLMAQDLEFVMELARGWVNATGRQRPAAAPAVDPDASAGEGDEPAEDDAVADAVAAVLRDIPVQLAVAPEVPDAPVVADPPGELAEDEVDEPALMAASGA